MGMAFYCKQLTLINRTLPLWRGRELFTIKSCDTGIWMMKAYTKSNLSAFMTLLQAAAKSCTNFCCESLLA